MPGKIRDCRLSEERRTPAPIPGRDIYRLLNHLILEVAISHPADALLRSLGGNNRGVNRPEAEVCIAEAFTTMYIIDVSLIYEY